MLNVKRECKMKKVFFLFAAAVLTLAGCEKNESPEQIKDNSKTIEISLVGTKAVINDSGSGAASFSWEAGDEIGVQTSKGLTKFTLAEFKDSKAVFKSPDGFDGTVEDGAFVAYPYVEEDYNGSTYAISYPSVYEVDKGDAFRLRWSGTLAKQTDNSFKTALEHTAAILRITYATVPEFATAVTMKADDQDVITVKFTQAKTENMNFYFPVLEGEYDAITVALAVENSGTMTEIDGTAMTLKKNGGKLALTKGKIYRTPTITLNLYELITDSEQIVDGDYVLAYHNGDKFNLFSFKKTMENAKAAAEAVKDVHGLSNLLAKGSQIYATVVGENYLQVPGNSGALSINVPASIETDTKLAVTGNAAAAKTTLSSGSYSLRLDKVITTINEDYSATLSVQPNAPDALNIMYSLRGGTVKITFEELLSFALTEAQKEGVTFTEAQVDRLKSGFEKICALAKDEFAEHGWGDLMDITLQTNAFDVVSRYYDNFVEKSLELAPEKKFGMATPIGFYIGDDGFTANIAVPQAGWFDRIQASLHYGEGTTEDFIAYWKEIDKGYSISGFNNIFERLARKFVSELHGDTFELLQGVDFTKIGNVYRKYVNRFNDQLEPVYLYKKVQ